MCFLLVVYLIVIPILKQRNVKSAQHKLDEFYNSLEVGDSIILSDGIKGNLIKKNSENEYLVEISKNVNITINKFGIVNKE